MTRKFTIFYYTIGAVIGMGGSIAANLYIGKNEYDGYRRVFTLAFITTAGLAAGMTAGGLLFLNPLVVLLGGKGAVGVLATDYLRWYVIGGGFTLFIYLPLNFLKIEGRPQASSGLFLLSSGLNVLLTWLFLSPVCGMGIQGASIATGLSMGLTTLIGLYLLFKKTANTRLVKSSFTLSGLKEVIACGSPNGCNNLLNALKILLFNTVLLRIGAAAYLPVFALVKSVSELVTGAIMGVASALMPIVGVYYGEKDFGSIRGVCRKALKIGGSITIALAALTALLPGPLCALFNITQPVVLENSRIALLCLAVSFLIAFWNLMLSGYFNTVKRPMLSNWILGLRLFFFLAPMAILLGIWLGADGVWLSLIAAEALALGTSVFTIWKIRRRKPLLDWYLLDTSLEGDGEISFSVCGTLDDVMFASNQIAGFCRENDIGTKKTMQVSLALEEMLTVIISFCMEGKKEQYIDIRIVKLEEDVLLRIRSAGKLFNPIQYYEHNENNEDMADRLLGIKLIVKAAKEIEFRETFGTNNLMIRF